MIRYSLSYPILTGLRLLRLVRQPEPGFRILLFHDVPVPFLDAFEKLVIYVVKNHGVIAPGEAASWLDGRPIPAISGAKWKMPCLFSFDDGFSSNFNMAEMILRRHGIKALFFVAPGLIKLSGEEQRKAIVTRIFQGRIKLEQIDQNFRLMNWEELARLKQQGHVIGCHGMLHRRLSELNGEILREEVINAGDILDTELQQQTDWYAYAFGDIGSIAATALQVISERYRYCRSGLRGVNSETTPALTLNADSMAVDAPYPYNNLLLEGGLDFLYTFKRQALKSMLFRRETFGPL